MTHLHVASPDLRVGRLYPRAWALFKEHLWLAVGTFVIYALLTNILTLSTGGLVLYLVELIVEGPVVAGTVVVALNVVRGRAASFAQIVDGFQRFGTAAGVYLAYVILTAVGLVLLVVPGLVVAVGLMPAMYLVVDAELDVEATLRRAWEMTRGHRWEIFVVQLVNVGVLVLGALALGVGLVFAGGLLLIVNALLYEELAAACPAA